MIGFLARLCLGLLLWLTPACAQGILPAPGPDGTYGFIDLHGEWVLKPAYHLVGFFSEGLAGVRQEKDGKAGYIDSLGSMVIAPKFDSLDFFQGGFAAVKLGNLWGYIDKNGHWLCQPQFRTAYPFYNGCAQVVTDAGKGGFVNGQGKFIEIAVGAFSNGLAPAPKLQAGKSNPLWGFVNDQGGWVVDPQFPRLNPLHEGLALASDLRGLVGYVDPLGNWAIAPQFQNGLDFFEDLAPVKLDGKWGYLDPSGKMAIPPQFMAAYPFCEGLAAVTVGKKKTGYIDKTGTLVIAPQFAWAGPFRGGRAWASQDGKRWGIINSQGAFTLPPELSGEMQAHEGFYLVKISNQEGYIDADGKWLFRFPPAPKAP